MRLLLVLVCSLVVAFTSSEALGDWEDKDPSWSPDGSQIAFHSNRTSPGDIYVMPATGGPATQLTFDPARDAAPAWSPDGTQIAFSSDRSGNIDVWVMPATGGDRHAAHFRLGVGPQPRLVSGRQLDCFFF